jgi:hypothetical protein
MVDKLTELFPKHIINKFSKENVPINLNKLDISLFISCNLFTKSSVIFISNNVSFNSFIFLLISLNKL